MEYITKILIFTMTLAMLMSLTNMIYHTTDLSPNTELENVLSSYDQFALNYYNQIGNTTPQTQSVFLEQQFGDLKTGGKAWFNILSTAVGFPDPEPSASEEEIAFQLLLSWMIRLIYIFNGALIFFILYTKFNN